MTIALAATLTSSISTSCALFTSPNPIVWTGKRRFRSDCRASTPMPEPPIPAVFSSAVAEQQDRANGQVRSLCSKLLQPVANVRRRFYGHGFAPADPLADSTSEPIEACLKALLQSGENSVLKRGERCSFACFAVAVRNAMLRESSTTTAMMFCCELSADTVIAGCHSNSKNECNQCGLHSPDGPGTPGLQLGRGIAQPAVNQQGEPAAKRKNQRWQQPSGHVESSMNRPLVKTGLGYLKRN